MMKRCRTCKTALPLDAFYAHPHGDFGRMSICKECHKALMRKNRAAKVEQYRAYDAKRYQSDPKVRERHRRYKATAAGKAAVARGARRFIENNPEKRAAHIALGNAVRAGQVRKPDACEVCGATGKIHGHHDDYSRPLDVRWVCPPCHVAIHREAA